MLKNCGSKTSLRNSVLTPCIKTFADREKGSGTS